MSSADERKAWLLLLGVRFRLDPPVRADPLGASLEAFVGEVRKAAGRRRLLSPRPFGYCDILTHIERDGRPVGGGSDEERLLASLLEDLVGGDVYPDQAFSMRDALLALGFEFGPGWKPSTIRRSAEPAPEVEDPRRRWKATYTRPSGGLFAELRVRIDDAPREPDAVFARRLCCIAALAHVYTDVLTSLINSGTMRTRRCDRAACRRWYPSSRGAGNTRQRFCSPSCRASSAREALRSARRQRPRK